MLCIHKNRGAQKKSHSQQYRAKGTRARQRSGAKKTRTELRTLEALLLVKGIVQLGISVADLLGGHKHFETFAKTCDLAMTLRKRRHDLRVADCKKCMCKCDKAGSQSLAPRAVWEFADNLPMNEGFTHCTSMNSPTSLSIMRAQVRGSLQSTLFCINQRSKNKLAFAHPVHGAAVLKRREGMPTLAHTSLSHLRDSSV